jgi:DNA polymerase-3 subunit gamma/tau
MYQVIARKYRPKNFAELVGQEHVRATLANAIGQSRIAHGYIFSGQRGTGKTTVARILARCLNCEKGPTAEPCLQCAACTETGAGNAVDVIEIDAASNRGINEMRELRESVRYRPARDRFKVFIIDEAHQITSEAFNALLKTLEEPPEWVVFVLCTTEAHKIPATIASRCQQFSFRSVDFEALVARMQWICEQEGITAEPEALAALAQAGEGSVRDSLSALDQAISCCGNKLEGAAVRELLGLFSLDALGAVIAALEAGDAKGLMEIVAELESNGRHLQHYTREMARYFRNLLMARVAGAPTRLIAASSAEQEKLAATAARFSEDDLTRYLQLTLDLYKDLQYSLQPRLHLELGLLRLLHAGRLKSIEEALAGAGPAGTPGEGAGRGPAAAANPPAALAWLKAAPPSQPLRSALPAGGSLKERLLAALQEQGLTFLADAVAHSEMAEAGAEVRFTGPREFAITMKDPALKAALDRLAGRRVKVAFTAGAANGAAAETPEGAAGAPQPEPSGEDETTRQAMEHPEVQRFQEMFPGSQVRMVRNLKDWGTTDENAR